MTTWDDKWATPQARDYQRGLLADEIARAAIMSAGIKPKLLAMGAACFGLNPRVLEWAERHRNEWAFLIANARGYLDARRP